MMRSAYSGVKLLFILILVEASLVCSLRRHNFSCNETELNQQYKYPLESHDYEDNYLRHRRSFNPDRFKLPRRPKPPPPRVHPYGIVTIKLDIWNKTDDSYKANVTITFNYLEKQHIEGIWDIKWTWDLKWTWNADEILLSTVGAKGTQHNHVSTGDDKCYLNSVTFEDLPPQTVHNDRLSVPNGCEDGLIPPWLKEADLAKSSCSFQISVSQANIKYRAPPERVTLYTQLRHEHNCDFMVETTTTPGYENTWRSKCHLYFTPLMRFLRQRDYS